MMDGNLREYFKWGGLVACEFRMTMEKYKVWSIFYKKKGCLVHIQDIIYYTGESKTNTKMDRTSKHSLRLNRKPMRELCSPCQEPA